MCGITVLLLVFVVFTPCTASAGGPEVAIGLWNHDPQGDIAYRGGSLSLEDELKYSDKTRPFGRAKIDMPLIIPNIYLMATPVRFDGKGSKNIPFTFGDQTFQGNTPFDSKLRLDHYDIALYYGLPFIKTATLDKLNIDVGLNVRFIDLKAEVIQDSTKESKSFILPVPMAYMGVQLKPVKKLSFEAEFRGIAYSSNHHYDLIGRSKYKVVGPAFIAAGYRYEDIKIDEKDVKANLRFAGPFAEAGIEF